MKRLLLLLIALPQLACAADGPQRLEHPFKLRPVYFDLGDESVQHVTNISRLAALTGCAVGAAGGSYLANRCKDLSPFAKISITLGAAGAIGVPLYFLAKWRAIDNSPEMRVQNEINEQITRNNVAYDAHVKVRMKSCERQELENLIFADVAIPDNRIAVYECALYLLQADPELKEAAQSLRPIATAVCYLAKKALQLEMERDAEENMNSDWQESKLVGKQREREESIRESISRHKKNILAFNNLLLAEELSGWVDEVRQLPEFGLGGVSLSVERVALKEAELEIKNKLARLAVLDRRLVDCINPDLIGFMCMALLPVYPNTPEGENAKQNAIESIKDEINAMMQGYQERVNAYNAKMVENANSSAEIPEAIENFVMKRSGENRYINEKLLEYNMHLNQNDRDALWVWIQSCFVKKQKNKKKTRLQSLLVIC